MGLTQTVAPATEPLTLAEAKAHLRISADIEDALIQSQIIAARQACETYSARQFITATFALGLRDFPCGRGWIELPRTPVQSVTSVTYVDGAGDSVALATTAYELVKSDVTALIVLKPGQSWPSVQSERFEPVTVTFVAGYGAASAVPDAAKSAMKLMIGHLYEQRESVNIGNIVNEIPTMRYLLDTIAGQKIA